MDICAVPTLDLLLEKKKNAAMNIPIDGFWW